nr:hypothetical protein CFP56_22292 [Quercus suber]
MHRAVLMLDELNIRHGTPRSGSHKWSLCKYDNACFGGPASDGYVSLKSGCQALWDVVYWQLDRRAWSTESVRPKKFPLHKEEGHQVSHDHFHLSTSADCYQRIAGGLVRRSSRNMYGMTGGARSVCSVPCVMLIGGSSVVSPGIDESCYAVVDAWGSKAYKVLRVAFGIDGVLMAPIGISSNVTASRGRYTQSNHVRTCSADLHRGPSLHACSPRLEYHITNLASGSRSWLAYAVKLEGCCMHPHFSPERCRVVKNASFISARGPRARIHAYNGVATRRSSLERPVYLPSSILISLPSNLSFG